MQSEYAQNYVPGWHNKLEGLQEYSDSDLHTEEYTESEQREEWMILADFSISNNSSDPEASSLHNWQTTSYPYTSQQIAEMPSWIISQKQTYIYKTSKNPFNDININTFSDMQALAYNLVKEHFESPSQEPPLLLKNKWICRNWQKLPYKCFKISTTAILHCDCHYWKGIIQYQWQNNSFSIKFTCWSMR